MACDAASSYGPTGLHRLVSTRGTTGAPSPAPFPVIERRPLPIPYSNSFRSHNAKCCGERRAITVSLVLSTGGGRWRQICSRGYAKFIMKETGHNGKERCPQAPYCATGDEFC